MGRAGPRYIVIDSFGVVQRDLEGFGVVQLFRMIWRGSECSIPGRPSAAYRARDRRRRHIPLPAVARSIVDDRGTGNHS